MTHFAGQLRVCKSELDLRLEAVGTDEERFAIAAMYGFESSVAALFQARETQCNPEQFLASCGYVTIASNFLRTSKVKDSIWKNWPKRKAPLGQYHFSALVPSALGLAVQFTEGMYAEISLARLTAFPNQNVEVRELVELREWRETFWLQLKTNRPELADWPLWSLHQWRDEAVAQLRNEYEEFANVQANDSAKKRIESDEFVTEKIAEIDSLSESELLQTASRMLMSFFHRWRRMPNDTERLEFNGTVGLSLALPHFEQEFRPLMRCLYLCQTVATQRNMQCTSLDELVAMLRHYELVEAIQRKFGAIAELDRIRKSIQLTKQAAGTEAVQQSAMKALIETGLANVVRTASTTKSADQVSAIMRKRWEDKPETKSWSADRWVLELGCTKRTIVGNKKEGIPPCAAWAERMAWKESNKQARKRRSVP